MRFIELTEAEREYLLKMHKMSTSHVTRERSQCLLLSDQRHSMSAIPDC
jgi:hypothetical protein